MVISVQTFRMLARQSAHQSTLADGGKSDKATVQNKQPCTIVERSFPKGDVHASNTGTGNIETN